MRAINSTARARQQRVSVATMEDTCVREASSGVTTLDSYGQPTVTYPDAGTFACHLTLLSATEQAQIGTNEVVVSGQMRFPLGVTLNAADKVRITQRYGAVGAVVYEVIGSPRANVLAQECDLRRVTL